jgi:D-glycero-alpha-D-manno-heptose-7-phosphate kinase
MIISRTPFRISFFGGGSDYPAWYRKYGGSVLGTTIDKYCYISLRYLPPFFDYKHRVVYSKVETVNEIDEFQHPAVRGVLKTMGIQEGLEVHHDGDLPARSGLGSSSSFTVGLVHAIKALQGEFISKRDLANMAVHIEQDILKENVGSQDQIMTAMGGFNLIEFRTDDTYDVTPIILTKDRIEDLQQHMMLFFTGFTRIASDIAKKQIENLEKKKKEIDSMQMMVREGMRILQGNGDMAKNFGGLLHEYWKYKRAIADNVSNPAIDQIYNSAQEAGAYGGKLLGAGGGGFMLILAPHDAHEKIREKLRHLTCVSFRFDFTGSKIVIYEPDNFQQH